MKIVIEYVLIQNFLINFIVLQTTGLFLREKPHFSFLFSLLSACVTVAIPALGLSTGGNFLLVLGLNMFLLPFCFKFMGVKIKKLKELLRLVCVFYLSSFLYGGACYFLEGLLGQNMLVLCLVAVVTIYFFVKKLAKISKKRQKIENFCCKVEIFMGERQVSVRGFLDSGNVLSDPVTGKDVTLINLRTFEKLCSNVGLEDVLLRNEKVNDLPLSHYISVQSIGSGDKILVFQADSMMIGESRKEKPILGLTFKDFKSLRSDVILPSEILAKT